MTAIKSPATKPSAILRDRNALDAEILRELLDYDPETGIFRWRVARGNRAKGDIAGGYNGNGYIVIRLYERLIFAHQLAWLYVYGDWPVNEIDHINGRRDDNRIENLRDVSHEENQRNSRLPSTNTSGVVGVSWDKWHKKFRSYIKTNGRKKHLGCFFTIEAATEARKAAEREHGYHLNHGRKAV